MSIQCRNPGGADERAEVVGRLKGLVKSVRASEDSRDGEGNSSESSRVQMLEEVNAFAIAIIGRGLTGDELREIDGK